ncbi:hypothetical protein AgCh_023405 [Apium graveolens]
MATEAVFTIANSDATDDFRYLLQLRCHLPSSQQASICLTDYQFVQALISAAWRFDKGIIVQENEETA